MTVVIRELVRVVPKKIWPHTAFSQLTASSSAELRHFVSENGLDTVDFISMDYHPHYRLNEDGYKQAVAAGADMLSKADYDAFVSHNKN